MSKGILKEGIINQKAHQYYETYRPQMDILESSQLSRLRGRQGITPYDVYALGTQLEAFQIYEALCEEDGNKGQLGRIPDIALDVIGVVYATSIMPLIASVQPEFQRAA